MVPDDSALVEEIAFLRAEVRRLRKARNDLSAGLAVLLKRRGFLVYKQEPSDDLLLPSKELLDDFYRRMHKYSFRLFLRDVIRHQEYFTVGGVAKYAGPEVTQEYIDHLVSAGLVKRIEAGYTLLKRPITSFGATLEWFIAEVFRREFDAEAFWGVKFRRPNVGGDYDVIAKLEGSIFYVEVKSSPPKQIYDSEIAAFLDRVADLAPAAAIFLIDTELRMKDKLVPMFEQELRRRFTDQPPVERLARELFHIRGRIFIVNAKESILRNIETTVSRYFREAAELPGCTRPPIGKSRSPGRGSCADQ